MAHCSTSISTCGSRNRWRRRPTGSPRGWPITRRPTAVRSCSTS
jgi:hypothetical protein